MIYGKKNGGHRAFKRVKSLRSSQRDCPFALSRHCVTFPRRSITIPWCHTLSHSILVEIVCAYLFCDAWRVRDVREKMRSSNGCERPYGGSKGFQHLDTPFRSNDATTLHHVTAMLWYHMKHWSFPNKMWSLLWFHKLPWQWESPAKTPYILDLVAHISKTNSVTPLF